jgi:hypothetical protein
MSQAKGTVKLTPTVLRRVLDTADEAVNFLLMGVFRGSTTPVLTKTEPEKPSTPQKVPSTLEPEKPSTTPVLNPLSPNKPEEELSGVPDWATLIQNS